MDILPVTSSYLYIQPADRSQELWRTRLKATQVLHRIRNVRSVFKLPILQLVQVATPLSELWTQHTHS